MDPSEYFGKFREEWADLAADIDQPDHWLKIGEVIEHCERCGNVPQIATVRRRNDRNSRDRLARRHCAVRDVATGGGLLRGSRPPAERIRALPPPACPVAAPKGRGARNPTRDALRRRRATDPRRP